MNTEKTGWRVIASAAVSAAVIATAGLCAAREAHADTLVLKSGERLEGTLVERTGTEVKFDLFDSGAVISFPVEEVDYSDTGESFNDQREDHLLFEDKALFDQVNALFNASAPAKGWGAFYPDDARWPLLYYYRNKDEANLIAYLQALAAAPDAVSGEETAVYYAHFFAAAISLKPELLSQAEALAVSLGGADTFLGRVAAHAKEYAPVGTVKPENVPLLWAEFRATGDPSPLKKLAAALQLENDAQVVAAVQRSLVVECLRNLDALKILKEAAAGLDSQAKMKYEAAAGVVQSLSDISGTYMRRGYNYARLNDYDAAFDAYQIALRICPDYAAALNNVGNLYKRVREDMVNYQRYLNAALYANPEYYSAAYNLGIFNFLQGRHDDAIRYYSRALEYEPDKPEYQHAIGRAYQEKGDQENAVRYFKRYLELAPQAEHAHLVKEYLARSGVSVVEQADDPGAMLEQGRFAELESYLEGVQQRKERTADGFDKLNAVLRELSQPKAMGKGLSAREPLVSKWLRERPESHFAHALAGQFYMDYAWEARGTGFHQTVTEKGGDLFFSRLKIAQEHIEKAYDLDPLDAVNAANMLIVVRGAGLGDEAREKWFARAVTADENSYLPYRYKLIDLMPKWGGTVQGMFAFAREAAAKAPKGTMIPLVLADAHWEMYYRDDSKRYFRDNPDVWDEVKRTYLRVLDDFPDSNSVRNRFLKAAYYAGDSALVNELYERIDGAWDPECWKSKKEFEGVL